MAGVLKICLLLASFLTVCHLHPAALEASDVDQASEGTINRTDCEPGATPPPNRVNTTVQLQDLRDLMNSKNMDAYVVPSADAHQQSGTDHDKRLGFISGYSGSAGTAVVTHNAAVLWTDGRYTTQADQQLDCNWDVIETYGDYVTTDKWLAAVLQPGDVVGVDPRLVTYNYFLSLEKNLATSDIVLESEKDNLIDEIWNDQPAESEEDIVVHDIEYAGEEWENKVKTIRADMDNLDEDTSDIMMVVTELDEIAWLLNLRGEDLPYSPVFYGYLILSPSEIFLHIKPSLSSAVQEHLNVGECTGSNPDQECVQIGKYEEIFEKITEESKNYDRTVVPSNANYAVYEAVHGNDTRLLAQSPIVYRKAVKNEIEIKGMKTCHIRDSVALSRFLAFLEKEIDKGNEWNELTAERKLKEFREQEEHFKMLSFRAISAVGPNGAVIHYRSENSTNRDISKKEMYLLDSGGQYLECTTDITRTMHYGNPTKFQIQAYTRVLMGAIDYATLVFPETEYSSVDAFARHHLWNYGLDYKHGTSHGIGAYLYIHENIYPARYPRTQPGLFMSDEPGYYEVGSFGVRLETVITTVRADTTEQFDGIKFMTFEPATLVPFEPKLIDQSLLNKKQVDWLNKYNKLTRDNTGKLLKDKGDDLAYNWLMARTGEIKFCSSSSRLVVHVAPILVGAVFWICNFIS